MKYIPPYRIENGSIYKYNDDQNAYVFYGKKIMFKAQEIVHFHIENADFEKKYDEWRDAQ
jgi:hypothetical protein